MIAAATRDRRMVASEGSQLLMSLPQKKLDVLVVGSHPSAALAAALLAHKSKLHVSVLPLPSPPESGDRIVAINPEFYALHPLLAGTRKAIAVTGIFGADFLGDPIVAPNTGKSKAVAAANAAPLQSGYLARREIAFAGRYGDFCQWSLALARAQGVDMRKAISPDALEIQHIDEDGCTISTNGKSIEHFRTILVSDGLPPATMARLSLAESWEPGVMHRYSWMHIPATVLSDLSEAAAVGNPGGHPVTTLSLNLADTGAWGWMLLHQQTVQLAIMQPTASLNRHPPLGVMKQWIATLRAHGRLKAEIDPATPMHHLALPLAGALVSESVGNRALRIGPAGGFYSASGEDLYPNCWSAVIAADAIKKALAAPIFQDALAPYRMEWRSVLAPYLRGPQQNLALLLPMVLRNPAMAQRCAEAILLGLGVVR
jgi:flavin-dependent dehydrogenase